MFLMFGQPIALSRGLACYKLWPSMLCDQLFDYHSQRRHLWRKFHLTTLWTELPVENPQLRGYTPNFILTKLPNHVAKKLLLHSGTKGMQGNGARIHDTEQVTLTKTTSTQRRTSRAHTRALHPTTHINSTVVPQRQLA